MWSTSMNTPQNTIESNRSKENILNKIKSGMKTIKFTAVWIYHAGMLIKI